MRKYVLFFIAMLIAVCGVNTSYATDEVFPGTVTQKRHLADGYTNCTIYDAVGNITTVPLDHTPPTVSTPRYDGDNYVIDITTNKSATTDGYSQINQVYLWKVEDDNGTETYTSAQEITTKTVSRPMEGVTYIKVYDHANNTTTVHLEKTPPTVGSPTYNQGNYIVSVSDSDSGIWKITDGNASDDPISAGTITRAKTINGSETIYVYDKANNVTTVGLTASKPKIINIDKKASETNFTLKASDAVINLWKVTEVDNNSENVLSLVSGTFSSASKSCNNAKFNLSNNSIKTIRVYNQAGNYTEVDLTQYEWGNFGHTYTCRATGGDYTSITVYDAVGNPTTVLIDNESPTATTPIYRRGFYTIVVADDNSGIWKVVDTAGTYYTSAGAVTREHTVNGEATVTVYDKANHTTNVSLTGSKPVVKKLKKLPNDRNIKLTVSDSTINLWKVTESASIEADAIAELCGLEDSVEFETTTTDVSTIYIFNHAGNYISVNLEDYESSEFGMTKTYRFTSQNMSDGYTSISIYDGVGNVTTVTQDGVVVGDSQNPAIDGTVYTNNANTMFRVSATDAQNLNKITDQSGNLLARMSGTSCSVNFEAQEISTFEIYDAAYNHITVSEFETDSTPPSVTPDYVNGVLRVQDEESGLWKITDRSGQDEVVLEDFSETFPTSEQTYPLTVLDKVLYVYDAVGNVTSIDFRREIAEDTTITANELNGIKVTANCTITFANTEPIVIGSIGNSCPGIEVADGVTLTIDNQGTSLINIYGGAYKSGSNVYKCAGIYVPSTSTLNLQGVANSKLNVYGNGQGVGSSDRGKGTGAGIGGNGVYLLTSGTISCINSGRINISSGNVNCEGGSGSNLVYGTGAGIGGGGLYNAYANSVIGGNLSYVAITGTAKVSTTGGYLASATSDYQCYGTGAGIGGGGVYNLNVTTTKGGSLTDGVISTSKTITATGGYGDYDSFGTGAGIGGGGVYNGTSGGDLTNITVSCGDITATGGYSLAETTYTAKGTGAGFGGGGLLSTESEATIVGGSLTAALITGGDVKGIAGYGVLPYGTGAGIGGGGVASLGASSSITKGAMGRMEVEDLSYVAGTQSLTEYGLGAEIGEGGVYGLGVNTQGEEFVDGEPPRVIRAFRNSDWNGFSVTATDNKALNKITKTNDRTVEYTKLSGTECGGSFKLESGTITSFDVVDMFNNAITVANFELDSDEPEVSVSYELGTYTITATDEVSGLWKITDDEDNTVEDWNLSFPTTTIQYQLTEVYNRLKVYDGVGNVKEISLKREISDDAEVSGDEIGGIKVLDDCTITFTNQTPITIGNANNPNSGIEVANGVTLTIVHEGNADVNIYGGHATDDYGSSVKYAGISVPEDSILNLQGDGTAAIKVYGYGVGNATGAGIGGNGVTVANASSVALANAGTINISSGTVYAYGGYASDGKSGTGAGIGGGGVYNNTQTSLTAGALTSVAISGGTVYAYGGSSSGDYAMYGTGAGIGGGGVWDNKCTGNLVGGHIGTISISNNSTVDAIGGFTGSNTVYGSGAGIGGGGVYHESTAATITGGGITSGVSVSSINSTRGVGGYCSTSYEARGTGAGIGGGGVYSKAGNNVGGGSVASATFTGSGTVIVKGGFGSGESKATGAHMGGGGVYTENNATNVTVGELSNLRVSDNASINTFSLG